MSAEIHGTCDHRFAEVEATFRQSFTRGDEIGAAICVTVDGVPVVDLWGGLADRASKRRWQADTPVVTFSVTKGFVALALLMLQDRGRLDLDAPVARYWPAFAAHGKADITVRTLLNHRAGLSAVDAPIQLEAFRDPVAIDTILANQRPAWTPGSAQGYGATAWGMYAGALFRHVAGETVGTFLRREVFGPLGADVWLGCPADVFPRVATMYPVGGGDLVRHVLPALVRGGTVESQMYRAVLGDRSSMTAKAVGNPVLGKRRLDVVNDPEVLAMELPWKSAVGTARGVAKVYAPLACGGALGDVRLVRPESLASVTRRQSWAWSDRVVFKPLGFAQGFVKDEPTMFSPNEAAFGHPGAGGALGLADPTHRLSVGYVMNRMDHRLRSPRALALCHAVYRSLGYG
jgi:CubicO group peptidase (beta-lactamase class C family)